jgi:hypothetical protein
MDFFSDMAKQNQIDAKILKDNILKDVIHNRHGHWVANSYIDENLWFIYSDYGSVAYCWGSIGCDTLKEFIVSADEYYLTKKLVEYDKQREVDWEATKKSIKKWILEERRCGDSSKEDARELFDDLYYCECVEEYSHQTNTVSDFWEYIVYVESNYSKALREQVIKPLKELFAKQIKESV